MATYLTDDGICLRVNDFSETSQIVGMFTRRHGLVPLIAKGSKRSSKKNVMSGPLDLLTSGEVVFVPARESGGAQLGTLAAWELQDHRRELRGTLAGLNGAMICAQITTQLMQPLDPHEDLFEELGAALELLGHAPAQRARAVVAYVKAALMAAGYWPQLSGCLSCGRAVSDAEMRFSARAGGIVCGGGGDGHVRGECKVKGGCHLDNAGVTIAVAGRVVLALDRLPLPTQLRAAPPVRAGDEAALHMAMQLLLAQVEVITDKPVRTRYLLGSIFGRVERGENGLTSKPAKNAP